MRSSALGLLTAAAVLLGGPLSHAADIRLRVSNKVLSNNKKGDTRKSQRHLKVEIDNRERESFEGVTLEWTVIARDIRTRKLSIAGTGSKPVHLPSDEKIEVNSTPYSLSKTEGKVEIIGRNRNNPNLPDYKVDPDSGTRYAGYIVVLKKGEEILAEAATSGMKKRVKGLQKPKTKSKK